MWHDGTTRVPADGSNRSPPQARVLEWHHHHWCHSYVPSSPLPTDLWNLPAVLVLEEGIVHPEPFRVGLVVADVAAGDHGHVGVVGAGGLGGAAGARGLKKYSACHN